MKFYPNAISQAHSSVRPSTHAEIRRKICESIAFVFGNDEEIRGRAAECLRKRYRAWKGQQKFPLLHSWTQH